ncbi:DUF2169 domain-containing protein [Caballeronia sp. S22]|uniref:DUF2169 family type VI secretion system accessory protein n=1 Tax=Caballeronia sp. S22 TaxID=3137182 RepID=UPI003530E780
MWMMDNRTPYAVDKAWRQDRDGNKLWMVVVKATFDISPGGVTSLAEEQIPVAQTCKHMGAAGKTSLIHESDLFGVKLGTDVLVNGSAWAPKGHRARALDVHLRVGPVNKRLRVSGERYWRRHLVRGLVATPPEWFESMPIRYERAYGGQDLSADDPAQHRIEDRNPVGAGFAVRVEHCVDQRLPNIEYPDRLIESWRDRPAPAGLNAVDCSWSPRRQLAGTYDEAWQRDRFPLWAEDFDGRYNNCAPLDQQVGQFLRGGEKVELENLSRDGRVAFTLPRIHPCFRTQFGRDGQEHRGQLCTVLLEPDQSRVVMSWQTSIVCNHRIDDLDVTVVTQKTVSPSA